MTGKGRLAWTAIMKFCPMGSPHSVSASEALGTVAGHSGFCA